VLSGGITALVLAAQRNGEPGDLADSFGVSHKCLVPIAGRPLIEHVLATLSESVAVRSIIVSIDDVTVLNGSALAVRLIDEGKLRIIQAQDNLAGSVVSAAALTSQWPLLITTADNVLLTEQAIVTMIGDAGAADVAAAFARKQSVLAAHPEGQRRFYQFSDDAYSNCNCYWIASSSALGAANIFREGGQFSKHPMRIVSAFGLTNLIRFRLGMGSLAEMFGRFSRRLGLKMRPVIFPDGALAIDVDNARTYKVAESLLLDRQARELPEAA
jgi:GTP:adenosylcobinamide-phosphate guanylyltransferase